MGREGPNTLHPSRYIRYIYNRVCLEKGNVRAAAVSALAKFGIKLPALKSNVIVLLRRFLKKNKIKKNNLNDVIILDVLMTMMMKLEIELFSI